jgi:hypothetical protein
MDEDQRKRVLPYVSGGFFALGWFIFIDACVLHGAAHIEPPVELAHAIPGILATFSMLMVCAAPFRAFGDGFARSSSMSCARLWLFSGFIASFASMGSAAIIAQSMAHGIDSRFSYIGSKAGHGEASHRWVGAAAVLQTLTIFGASMLWMTSRLQAVSGVF